MSIHAGSALVSGGYEIDRVTIDTQPETRVRLDLRSDQGTATVVRKGVAELEIRQQFSNWPFLLQFYDIADRQLEGLAGAVNDGQEDQFRCLCASVHVQTR
jgi:hypothetical protein